MADEVAVQEKKESAVAEATLPGRTYTPSVDISESEESLWLWADVPGVDENSIDVQLENNQLTIEGRVSLDEYPDLTPVYTEYQVGNQGDREKRGLGARASEGGTGARAKDRGDVRVGGGVQPSIRMIARIQRFRIP